MRILPLLLTLCSLAPTVLQAYFVNEHELVTPYEVFILEQPVTDHQFVIGELEGYPEMIEFTTDTEVVLTVSLWALPENPSPNYGGIVVRVLEPRGVQEVARLKPAEAVWDAFREPVSKLSFLAGPEFRATVASGTYRVEVSTPENFGKYVIVLGGTETNYTYETTWQAVSALYEFAGVTKLGMMRTSLVYVPLLIMLTLASFGYVLYRTRDRLLSLKK